MERLRSYVSKSQLCLYHIEREVGFEFVLAQSSMWLQMGSQGAWLKTLAAGGNRALHLPFETQFKAQTAFWTLFVIHLSECLGNKPFQDQTLFSHFLGSLSLQVTETLSKCQSGLQRICSKDLGKSGGRAKQGSS